MKKTTCLLCILLCACVLVMGCFGGGTFVGTWQHDTQPVTYRFTEDMQVIITIEGQEPTTGTYSVDEKTHLLVLTVGEMQQTGQYEFSGRQLHITSPDTGATITMTRISND